MRNLKLQNNSFIKFYTSVSPTVLPGMLRGLSTVPVSAPPNIDNCFSQHDFATVSWTADVRYIKHQISSDIYTYYYFI